MLEATKDVKRNKLVRRKQLVRQVYKLLTGSVDQQLPKVHAVVKRLAERMFRLLGEAAPSGVRSSWRPPTYHDFVLDAQSRKGKGDDIRITEQHYDVKLLRYTNSAGDICEIHQDWTR